MNDEPQVEMALTPENDPQASLLAPLLTCESEIKAEHRKRVSLYDYKSIPHSDIEEYEACGWKIQKKHKRTTRVKREKKFDLILENRTWCVFEKMGYKQLNGDKFKINFTRDNGTKGSKQIDVFACDDETAIVVECKAKQERGKRSIQKDILETKALQEYIRKSIFDLYGVRRTPKVVWIYVTENIIWSPNDADRANDSGIIVITENELQYYEAFLEHVGPAGKYQIIGDFLDGQKIPGLADIRVPAIKGKIGGEDFFSFVVSPRTMLKISFINHQALSKDDGKPSYQRMMTDTRLKKIGEFIKDGGYFPTNILVNFTTEVRFDKISNKENTDPNITFGWLTLPSKYRSAWIIDGQHRLYGYSKLPAKYLEQCLIVVAFNNMENKKEAELFININSEQKSVPRGLLVSLLPDLRMGSDKPKEAITAIASGIVRSLNLDKSSPLFRRFAMHGLPPDEGQNLTISEAVNGLVKSGLIGKVHNKNRLPGVLCSGTDERTIKRASNILSRYFDNVFSSNPERWKLGRAAYICINPGIRAHIMLIAEVVRHLTTKKGLEFDTLGDDAFIEYILPVTQPVFEYFKTASDEKIKVSFSKRFGEGGVKDYFFELCSLISDVFPDFGSEEFKKHEKQKDEKRVEDAHKHVIDITQGIMDTLPRVLMDIYGDGQYPSGEYHYWEKGVHKNIRKKVYEKMQDEEPEKRHQNWVYLDIVDIKQIIETPANWPAFKQYFNIPLPTDQKGKQHYTSWLIKFNELRRVPGHKSSARNYTDEDLELLDWIRVEFFPRIGKEQQ